MTKRLTRRITQSIKKTVRQDTLGDIFSRAAKRMSQIGQQFEGAETHIKRAYGLQGDMVSGVGEINASLDKSLLTNTSLAVTLVEFSRGMAHLGQIVQEQGEEISQANIDLATVRERLAIANNELAQAAALAKSGKYDAANVEMLMRTGELFTQSDPETILVFLQNVDPAKWQEARAQLDERRRLELGLD